MRGHGGHGGRAGATAEGRTKRRGGVGSKSHGRQTSTAGGSGRSRKASGLSVHHMHVRWNNPPMHKTALRAQLYNSNSPRHRGVRGKERDIGRNLVGRKTLESAGSRGVQWDAAEGQAGVKQGSAARRQLGGQAATPKSNTQAGHERGAVGAINGAHLSNPRSTADCALPDLEASRTALGKTVQHGRQAASGSGGQRACAGVEVPLRSVKSDGLARANKWLAIQKAKRAGACLHSVDARVDSSGGRARNEKIIAANQRRSACARGGSGIGRAGAVAGHVRDPRGNLSSNG